MEELLMLHTNKIEVYILNVFISFSSNLCSMEVSACERNGNKTKLSGLPQSEKHWVDISNTRSKPTPDSPHRCAGPAVGFTATDGNSIFMAARGKNLRVIPDSFAFTFHSFETYFEHCSQRDTLLKHQTNHASLLLKTLQWLPLYVKANVHTMAYDCGPAYPGPCY